MRTVQSEAEEICIYVDDTCDTKVVAYESFISGVEFAQRWIPVEEELPPIGEKVITKMTKDKRTAYGIATRDIVTGKQIGRAHV